MEENEIGSIVLGAAIKVHRVLGPGLLESVYEETLAYELLERNLKIERQVEIPVKYKSLILNKGFRADLIVEDKVLLELKSVERIEPSHKKQIHTYLKLTKLRLGYLLNFNVEILKHGITRIVNRLPDIH